MVMKEFDTGAIREDKTGKGRMDLLPMCALLRLGRHMENSLKDHPERNWEKGLPMHSFIDSALRHLFKYVDGQTDEDHLCAAAWNILCAMWTEEKKPEMQDIPSRPFRCVPSAQDNEGASGYVAHILSQRKATESLGEGDTHNGIPGSET